MKIGETKIKWLLWLLLTLIIAFWLGYSMLSENADRTIFMPGALSPGHHQLAQACDACHVDSFGGGEVLQQACVDCHGKDRVKPLDSHPAKKFKDPRNADLLDNIDALRCTTCHSEHKPEITAKDGLTQPVDFCFYCHQDIAEDRPSHEGMGFDTCKTAGCHNFHNNRALYTDYLIKHLHEPVMLEAMVLPQKEFARVLDEIIEYPRDRYPVKQLTEDDIDATDVQAKDESIKADWLATAHARSGVNCSACHVPQADHAAEVVNESADEPAGKEAASWTDRPDLAVCKTCHSVEVERFGEGKHGMRLKQGLSPMTPASALLPMQEKAAHEELTCNSCHPAHRFDVNEAAVEPCLGCHADEHSLAYKDSPHYRLWQKEMSGEAEAGTGVSCASCHMPRVNHDVSEWLSRIIVDHNQSANLSPNSKMVRTSCQHCHGLEFTLDVMSDKALIDNNFKGRTKHHVQTMELAEQEDERRKQEKPEDDDASMFGF
jgi:predicted CXXCH cytochrome family protein